MSSSGVCVHMYGTYTHKCTKEDRHQLLTALGSHTHRPKQGKAFLFTISYWLLGMKTFRVLREFNTLVE